MRKGLGGSGGGRLVMRYLVHHTIPALTAHSKKKKKKKLTNRNSSNFSDLENKSEK
jgi:hypothetical protein